MSVALTRTQVDRLGDRLKKGDFSDADAFREGEQDVIFLIEYDRENGKLIKCEPFEDSDREHAEDVRLKLELSLNRRAPEREVVLLEAASEEAIRRTHSRYFWGDAELAVAPPDNSSR